MCEKSRLACYRPFNVKTEHHLHMPVHHAAAASAFKCNDLEKTFVSGSYTMEAEVAHPKLSHYAWKRILCLGADP